MTKLQVRHAAPIESKQLVSRQHQLNGRLKVEELVGSVSGLVATPNACSSASFKNGPSNRRADGEDRHLTSCEELMNNYTLQAVDGKVGSIKDLIIDDDEWRVRYLIVQAGVLFARKWMLLPARFVDSISFAKQEILVNSMRSSVEESPDYDCFKKYITN